MKVLATIIGKPIAKPTIFKEVKISPLLTPIGPRKFSQSKAVGACTHLPVRIVDREESEVYAYDAIKFRVRRTGEEKLIDIQDRMYLGEFISYCEPKGIPNIDGSYISYYPRL